MSIPALIVLKVCEGCQHHKKIASRFGTETDIKVSRKFAARIEKFILIDQADFNDEENKVAQTIKSLGMGLSRSDAQEFNQFITAALGE